MGDFFWTAAKLGQDVQEMDKESIQLIDKMSAPHRDYSEEAPFEKRLARKTT